jgi:hypothetical protein
MATAELTLPATTQPIKAGTWAYRMAMDLAWPSGAMARSSRAELAETPP